MVSGVVVKRVTAMGATARQVLLNDYVGNTLWYTYAKCVAMPCAFECTCCRELPEVEEHLEESDTCVMSLEAFKTVCLDKDALYTTLVTMHTVRGMKSKHQ